MVRSVGLKVNHELESGQHRLYRWGMFDDELPTKVFYEEISRKQKGVAQEPTCTPHGIHDHRVDS